ncbi:hypothetical protein N136_03141 [Leifsonia aquatica ATCC 14665]|uniref:Uncharacterized protein n=2 Tax=Leifsonia aquatica TaxID=144185 RepID=U2RNW8_LEIAQ|nr:hypothetical protein N136_03141 [Leifsonia aquatica ATCC 14665]
MSVVGVDTDDVGACGRRFEGYPESPVAVAMSGSESVSTAVSGFAVAWGRADGRIANDDGEFVARLTRASSLFAEAEASIAEQGRRSGS